MARIPVAVLGATGMVGQRFLERLANHPRFEVAELAASDRSAGKAYAEACTWRLEGDNPLPNAPVVACTPEAIRSKVVFSALDKGIALDLEPRFAAAGHVVISNASAFRMAPSVPLLIPEINPEHAAMVGEALQQGRGAILTNPNCTCIPATMVLAPLHRRWGVEAVCLSSYQAVSGAGYPGESAWDMLGNVHPHAGDEEAKVAEEPRKILGTLAGGEIQLAPFPISARCVRVPVLDGHLVAVQVKLAKVPSVEEVQEVLAGFTPPFPLPSTPSPLFHLLPGRDRPQPKLDAGRGAGMAISVGRIEPCEVLTLKFFALAHNAIRGAAGGAIANAELLDAHGWL